MVKVDGTLLTTIHPEEYSLQAVAAYPDDDSSNTGFDESHDISGFANGAHTVTVTAYSTDGASTTDTISVTKASSGCASSITDASPAGTPLAVELDSDPTQTAATITKAKHTKKGLVSINLGNIGTEGCTLIVYSGDSESTVSTRAGTFTVTSADVTKGSIQLQAKKIKINKKNLSNVYFSVEKSCDNFRDITSSFANMKVKTKKGKIIFVRCG